VIRRRHQGCACGTDLPGTCPGRANCPYSGDEPEFEDRSHCGIEELDVGEELTHCIHCGSRCKLDEALLNATSTRRETCIGCGQQYNTYDEEPE
jgi:hypothetical protein